MTCEHCVRRVKEALESLDGLETKVDLENNLAYTKSSIDYDDNIIKKVIEDAGYKVEKIL